MRTMGVLDVMAPVLVIVGAVAVVAVLYLGITAAKDRRAAKRERDVARGYEEKRSTSAHFKK